MSINTNLWVENLWIENKYMNEGIHIYYNKQN